MLKKLLITCGLFALHLAAEAQPNIPVDLVTGRALVTIPLWELRSGKLSVPVAVGNGGSGVKVNDTEGTAGVGWNLLAGGEVSREVRGLPDDYDGNPNDASDTRKGRLISYAQQINDFVPSGDDALTVCSDESADWTYINDLLTAQRDTEPDIFHINAPGLSGQFVFGPDKTPRLLSYQDLKFSFVPATLDGPITAITITRNDGVKYAFTLKETSIRQAKLAEANKVVTQFLRDRELYRKSTEFSTAWKLTSITSPAGEGISLTYGNEQIASSRADVDILIADTVDTQYYVTEIVKKRPLTAISAPAQQIDISWFTYPQRVTTVAVTDRVTGTVKDFYFHYAPVKHAADVTGQFSRLFLREIQEKSPLCFAFPAYRFSYYGITFNSSAFGSGTTEIPFHADSTKQDLWGYFNNTATDSEPSVYFYEEKTGAERYRFYKIPGQEPTASINASTTRQVNTSTIQHGSLQTIAYPTGGSATIIYEPNAYHDAEANTSNYGPGLRVKQVVTTDGIAGAPDTVIDYEYTLADGKSSGKWINRPVFGYHDVENFYATKMDMSPAAFMLYERVTVKQTGKGKTVYEYLLPGAYPLISQDDFTATKTKFARASGANCLMTGELEVGYYQFPFSPNPNYDFERGLVSRIATYLETNSTQPLEEKLFAYQRLSSPLVVVKGLRYEKLFNANDLTTGGSQSGHATNLFAYGHYGLLTNLGKVVFTETYRTADMSDLSKITESSVTYTFNSSHHLLQHTTTQNSDGTTSKARYRYAKDFATLTSPAGSDVPAQMIKKLNDDFMHSAIVETITSKIDGGTETTTGASLTLYGNFPDSLGAARALPAASRAFTGTSGFAEATIAPPSGANQVFSFSPTVYQPSTTVTDYDFKGNLLSAVDRQRNKKAFHIGYRGSLPVAEISNAASNEVVYAGFETYTGREFTTLPPGVSYTDGRSGKKAVQLSTGSVMERANVVKGGTSYRYSCWLRAGGDVQVTFKVYNGAALVVSAPIDYPASANNAWQYFEGTMNLASAPASFTLKLESNGSVVADDILFYPASASVATATYEPLFGRTSQTDTRGVSSYFEYDEIGRLKYIKDQDLNLRQTNDYYYKAQDPVQLNANFTTSLAAHQIVKDATVTFTAAPNCASPVTHKWYVNDVLVNQTSAMVYTFTTAQMYTVRLVTEHTTGIVSNPVTYDVKNIGTGNIGVSVTTSDHDDDYSNCDPSYIKTFNTTLSGCYVLEDVTIEWSYNAGNGWVTAVAGASLSLDLRTLTFDPAAAFGSSGNMASYSVRCTVTTVCPVTGVFSTYTHTRNITYNYSSTCL